MNPLKEMTLNVCDIYQVNLDPTIGQEIKKIRPVVIINPGDSKNLDLAIVVPITNWQKAWENNPFFVSLFPTDSNNLKKKSAIDCFQIRAISHQRFISKIGEITPEQMNQVKASLALILDIYPEHCLE